MLAAIQDFVALGQRRCCLQTRRLLVAYLGPAELGSALLRSVLLRWILRLIVAHIAQVVDAELLLNDQVLLVLGRRGQQPAQAAALSAHVLGQVAPQGLGLALG